jgi:uncharacterized membrane protein
VNVLQRAGLLPDGQFLAAAHLVRDEVFWGRWGRRALLALGAGQVLAGIIFFFAYNWSELSDLAKFAVVEGGILLAVAAALIAGIDKIAGQVLLIAASVLTGVLLAVIGQAYQTGADVYELFLAWAVLILPWCFAARSAVLWVLWLVIAETALGLYGGQVLVPLEIATPTETSVLVGVTVALALAVRELAVRRDFAWAGAHWTRLALLAAATLLLFLPAAGAVLGWEMGPRDALSILVFLVAAAVGAWVYWRKLPDFAALVILIAFADAFLICVGFRLINELIGFDAMFDGGAVLATGILIAWALGATGGAAKLMRHLHAELKGATT